MARNATGFSIPTVAVSRGDEVPRSSETCELQHLLLVAWLAP